MATTSVTTVREVLGEPWAERSTHTLSFPLLVPDGSGGERAVLLSEITTATLYVYDLGGAGDLVGTSGARVDIKNTGRGVYPDANGHLTITLHAADNAILGSALAVGTVERHLALVEITYNGGTDALRKEIVIGVVNLDKVA